jgi:hypothetical protein
LAEKARDVDGKIGGKDGGMGNWGEVMEEVEVEELVVWFVVPPLSDSLTDFFFQNQDIRCFFRIFQHRYTIKQSRYFIQKLKAAVPQRGFALPC